MYASAEFIDMISYWLTILRPDGGVGLDISNMGFFGRLPVGMV